MKNKIIAGSLLLFLFCFLHSLSAQIDSFPYTENFDNWPLCTYDCSSSCSAPIASQWNIINGSSNHWFTAKALAFYPFTGPYADHTRSDSTGHYLLAHAGSNCQSSEAKVESPVFDFSAINEPGIEFWYHMYGSDMGTMHLDVSFDGGSTYTNDIVLPWTGDINEWQLKKINIGSSGLNYGNKSSVRFRIRALTGNGYKSDMAIDDFSAYQIFNYDAYALIAPIRYTIVPVSQLQGLLKFMAINIGLDTLMDVSIHADVSGIKNGFIYSQTSVPNLLPPGDSAFFNLPGLENTLRMLANPADFFTFTLTVSTNPTDQYPANNTFYLQLKVSDSIYSRDDNLSDFAYGIYNDSSKGGSIGNQFSIYKTVKLGWGQFVLGASDSNAAKPSPGDTVALTLWSYNKQSAYPDTLIAQSEKKIITSSASGQQISLKFDGNIILFPGDYVLCIEELKGQHSVAVAKTEAIYTRKKSWIRFGTNTYGNAAGWSNNAIYGNNFRGTPLVRMSLSDVCNMWLIPGNDTTICFGDSVILGANPTVIQGNPPYQYHWTPGNGLSDSTVANPIAKPSFSTLYTLYVEDNYTCKQYNSVYIQIDDTHKPSIMLNGNQLLSSQAASYQWYDDNGPINGATAQSYTPLTNGNYYVVVNDSLYNCPGVSDKLYYTMVGINHPKEPVLVRIFPNPGKGIIHFEADHLAQTFDIDIYDICGQSLFSRHISRSGMGSFNETYDLSFLAAGMYVFIISDKGGNYAKPFSVVK